MDATVTNIRLKSDEELRALAAAGVGHLYLGIESGLDDVLGTMEKDHTLEQAYEQIQRLRAAGLIYDAHIMTGIAGRGRGLENAEATAEFFNRTRPERIINFSLFLIAGTPLYEDAKAGRFFRPASWRIWRRSGGFCSLWSGRASAWPTMDSTTVSPSGSGEGFPGKGEDARNAGRSHKSVEREGTGLCVGGEDTGRSDPERVTGRYEKSSEGLT